MEKIYQYIDNHLGAAVALIITILIVGFVMFYALHLREIIKIYKEFHKE